MEVCNNNNKKKKRLLNLSFVKVSPKDAKRPMFRTTTSDLQPWKDFPKGLQILLLDEHGDPSSSEMRSRLESMDYVVSMYSDEDVAVSAVANKPGGFHVAIVEVSEAVSERGIGFLESVKDLPTIMISSDRCLDTTMKYITRGAVEFLHEPISEEKLRNIWQHAVHKAFNTGLGPLAESLRPVKETVVSRLHVLTEEENRAESSGNEKSVGNDKCPAPSTPQLKQVARLVDDSMDCQQDGEDLSKFVETTCKPFEVKEEDESGDCSRSESNVSPPTQVKDNAGDNGDPGKGGRGHATAWIRTNRKKMKVDWTPDLHKKFVQAVEQLGLDQAIPSRILELMKVNGLTRHNIASHLQKYRIQKRHIFPKDDEGMWSRSRNNNHVGATRTYNYPRQPIVAFPPYQPVWGSPGYPLLTWHHPPEYWHWKPYPGLRADVWGCPVAHPSLPYPFLTYPPGAQNAPGKYAFGPVADTSPKSTLEYYQSEEVIDKIVKEAIGNPRLPLPLGLKPPSPDTVLEELSKLGIRISCISSSPSPPQ